MPTIKVVDMSGKEVSTLTLSDKVFGAEVNGAVLHTAVKAYLANQRQGTQSTLTRAEVVRRGDEVLMYFEADGFLYNMVRIMAGTLLDISRGRIAPDSVRDIILSLDRDRAGATAPACGLCLEQVFYNGKD